MLETTALQRDRTEQVDLPVLQVNCVVVPPEGESVSNQSGQPHYLILPERVEQHYLSEPNPVNYLSNHSTISDLRTAFRLDLKEAIGLPDFEQRIQSIVNTHGFADYTFLRLDLVADRRGQRVVSPKVLLTGEPRECVNQQYMQRSAAITGYPFLPTICSVVANAPHIRHMLDNRQDIFVLIVSLEHNDYYIIPGEANRSKGSVLLSIMPEGVVSPEFHQLVISHKKSLELLANAIEFMGRRMFPDTFIREAALKRVQLNAKPMRLINMLAQEDITLLEAAEKLSLSCGTLNKQMAVIKSALGTQTMAGTIFRAVQEGLICERWE